MRRRAEPEPDAYLSAVLADPSPPLSSRPTPLQAAQRRLAFALCLRSGLQGMGKRVHVDALVRAVAERVMGVAQPSEWARELSHEELIFGDDDGKYDRDDQTVLGVTSPEDPGAAVVIPMRRQEGSADTIEVFIDTVGFLPQEMRDAAAKEGDAAGSWMTLAGFFNTDADHLLLAAKRRLRRQQREYLVSQISLCVEMCLGRNYLAIREIEVMLPRACVGAVVRNGALPWGVRAAFGALLLNLHLNRDPQEEIPVPALTRTWDSLEASTCAAIPSCRPADASGLGGTAARRTPVSTRTRWMRCGRCWATCRRRRRWPSARAGLRRQWRRRTRWPARRRLRGPRGQPISCSSCSRRRAGPRL